MGRGDTMDGSRRRALLASILIFAAAVLPLAAQTVGATISGRVLDPQGNPVDAATVFARALSTGQTRTTLTDEAGRFRFDSLQPGSWEVVAQLDGAPSQSQTVTLGLQQNIKLEVRLTAALEETIEVTSQAPLIDAQRSWTELRIDGETAAQLPVNGRSVTDLALLDSQVVATPSGTFYGERAAVFALNGQSGRANAFLVDGLDNGDRTSSTTLNSFFSQQVIKEYVVLKNQFAAEFGRAAGGVMNIITDRGANQHTAELFVQGTRPDWNSTGEFVSGLPRGEGDSTIGRRSFGFKLGGPWRRDKAFYFLAAETQDSDDVLPFTGTGRDGRVGGLYRVPNGDDNLFARTDFNLGQNGFLMARLSWDERASRGLNVEGTRTPEAGFNLDEEDLQLAASYTKVYPSGVIHEARFLVGDSDFSQRAISNRPGAERPSGIFGGNNLNAQDRKERRFQLVDNVSWTRQAHTYKVGLDLIRSRTDVDVRFNPNGNFFYITDRPLDGGDCGDVDVSEVKAQILALYDFDGDGEVDPDEYDAFDAVNTPIPCAGIPDFDDDGDGIIDEPGYVGTYPLFFSLIDGQPSTQLNDTQWALFAQDSWQASDNLALDFGLRYDASTYTLGADTFVPSRIPNGRAKQDNDNLAPRFGFNWQPNGDQRLVVRGGGGIFYDKIPLGFPAVAAITSGTRILLYFPQGLAQPITEDVVEEFGIDLLREVLVFDPSLSLRFSTGTKMETPYVVQWSAGVDHALGARGALSFDLVRALGYHQILMRDLNPVVEIGEDLLPVHADAEVGSIAAVVSEGRTWYTGATLAYRFRDQHGWASAAYTWSQALDLGPDPLKGGISLPPTAKPTFGEPTSVDNQIFKREKGRADTDRRHRVVLAGGGTLPWLGLTASATLQYASSLPFNVTTGQDENYDGQANDRPAGVGRNTGEDTPLDPINELRRENDLPEIESLDSPDFLQVDLRVARPYAARKFRGELFVQVFNLFNRTNYGLIEGRVVSKSFGEPLSLAGPPRTFEVGVRVGF